MSVFLLLLLLSSLLVLLLLLLLLIIVKPVYKKGDIYDIANYRTISLLPILSRIFEKSINKQLRMFLIENHLLNDVQHGFLHRRSCKTAFLRLTRMLFETRSSKSYTCMTAFDFSRAFDTVNQSILLQRISLFSDSSFTTGPSHTTVTDDKL